ncbi:CoA-binding [Rivularia sp. IAM M-261]|nr:CoA-binding [Rivularia sp. IAM M-261]
MTYLKLDDSTIRNILIETKTIAVVGHSDKPERTSYQIAQFLRSCGYKVIAVNPMVNEIDGQPSYPTLNDVSLSVDLVNVFRRAEFLPEIVDDAVAINAKTIWTQLGIYNEISAQKALQEQLNVVMNACIKVEYQRLNIRRQ